MKKSLYRLSSGWICLALMFALCQLGANAVLTGYLKIGDIQGESQRAGHEDEIDVFGIEWKISRPISTEDGSGRTRARAVVSPLTVKKHIDKSSPYLALAALNGRSLPEATLAVRKDSGDAHLDYLVITMTNVMVTSYEVITKDGEDVPVEEIGFSFESVNYKYVEQADDHSAGDEHEIEYDIVSGV